MDESASWPYYPSDKPPGGWFCPACGQWIDDLAKAKDDGRGFTIHPWCE